MYGYVFASTHVFIRVVKVAAELQAAVVVVVVVFSVITIVVFVINVMER